MFRKVLIAAVMPLALGSGYSYTYDYTDAPTAAPTKSTSRARRRTRARLKDILHTHGLVCAFPRRVGLRPRPAAGRIRKYGANT